MSDKRRKFIGFVLYWGIVLLLCWIGVRYVLLWLLPFLIALGLAYLMEPSVCFLREKLRLRRGFISSVLALLLLALILAVLTVLCLNLLQQSVRLFKALPQYLAELPTYFAALRQRLEQFCAACPKSLQSWLKRALSDGSQQLTTWFSRFSARCVSAAAEAVMELPSFFLFTATTVLAIFFTAAQFPRIMGFLRRQLPPQKLRQAGGVKENLLSTLAKWFKAQCILLSVTFVELLLGLLLIRQPYALLLAAIIAVIDALPVFGTGTFLLPWAALCLLLQQTPKAIALGAIYAVITLVRSFLEPKVMAAQVNLPPLAALIAMYIGFCTMGVTGMILFPVALLFLKQLQDAGYLHLWK